MPRGVASIDPQNSPLVSSPLLSFPPSASRTSSSPFYYPTITVGVHLPAVSSPCPPLLRASLPSCICPAGAPAILPGLLPFLPSRSHFLASPAYTGLPRPLPTSLFRRCVPHHRHPAATIPTAGADVTSSFDRGRCLELESRRVRRIRRTFADPGVRSLGNPSNEDQSHAWKRGRGYSRMGVFGFFPQDRVKIFAATLFQSSVH